MFIEKRWSFRSPSGARLAVRLSGGLLWISCALLLGGVASAEALPPLQLVQSCPLETELCHPDLPEAYRIWLDMIDGAGEQLDLAHFYLSNADTKLQAVDPAAGRLENIIRAIERAADRGVRVRILGEKGFYETYPETLDRLGARSGIEVRLYDVRARMGGVLHLKMLLVDLELAFLGSQNFDWRALEHIQELGIRITEPTLSRQLQELFETDWKLADESTDGSFRFLVDESIDSAAIVKLPGGPVRAEVVYSPRGWLPRESQWDLPRLLELIESAQERIRVQLLSYAPSSRGEYWAELDHALRQAAARGIRVEMLLASWETRPSRIEWIQSLQTLANVEVRLVFIPEWSGGFIPYARVVHAKYLVVDGQRAWLGTSNWSHDYFYRSRNVGVILEGEAIAAQLDAFFELGWNMEFSVTVDPSAEYPNPRIGD